MNFPIVSQQILAAPVEEATLGRYLDVLLARRWLIAAIACIGLALGVLYAFLAPRVYQADILLQVEDTPGSAKNLLGDVSSLFDVKAEATAEIEVLRSRMVVGKAVDSLQLYLDARPRRIPLIGEQLASGSRELSKPGLFGYGGYVWGNESIKVARFDVPQAMEGKTFTLTALGDGRFRLFRAGMAAPLEGRVGDVLTSRHDDGEIALEVVDLRGRPGAEFSLVRKSRLKTLERLQAQLSIGERGKQSGIIGASLAGRDRDLVARILNEIGDAYVAQNIKRKAAEAEKSVAFLNNLAPELKRQLEDAEINYNAMRNTRGTFNLSEEGKTFLQESVAADTTLLELRQRRAELRQRFTDTHPVIQALDMQIAAVSAKTGSINQRMRALPNLEQDTLRLMRDVRVKNDLYVGLLNTMQQLKLVEAGKVGTVRLLDAAEVPAEPIKPVKPMSIALGLLAGLVAGIALACVRGAFSDGVTDPEEIATQTGLNVYGTVPLSRAQSSLTATAHNGGPGAWLLAGRHPNDAAVESLRSLRTALQFGLLDARNNLVLLTGPTPGVGKSFVSSNLAALLGSAGRRVLLLDADMRRGQLQAHLGVTSKPGFADLLLGNIALEQALHRGVLPGLDFIACGSVPPNPAELLLNHRATRLLDECGKRYDLVLIDTPPVLAVSDTALLASRCGTVLLVTRFDQTSIGEVKESSKVLKQANVEVRGVIFNGFDPKKYRYGGRRNGRYRYVGYGYEAQGGKP